MKIFDGVPIKEPPSPFMQNALTVAMVLGKSFLEADKYRQERQANGGKRPTTLDDVMEKSGLKLPGLQEVLEQLMGSTEEAKKVASMIADNPDPLSLLQKFAAQFGYGAPAQAGPVVTPPPNPHAAVPPPSPQPSGPMPPWPPTPPTPAPPMTPPTPASGPTTWSMPPTTPPMPPPGSMPVWPTPPASTMAGSSPIPPTMTWPSAAAATSPMPSVAHGGVAEPRPSLVAMVEQRLGALHRRMKAHEAELDLRLQRAEAELAKLRQELHELRCGQIEPARGTAESQESQEGRTPSADASIAADHASEVAAGAPSIGAETAPEPTLDVGADPEVAAPLRVAATEQEVARAVELIGEFTEVVDQHHQQSLVRVVTLEQEVIAMRALVERERQAAGAAADG